MPTYDEISDLPKDDQQEFHRRVQKSLRKQWARAKNQTEIESERNRK